MLLQCRILPYFGCWETSKELILKQCLLFPPFPLTRADCRHKTTLLPTWAKERDIQRGGVRPQREGERRIVHSQPRSHLGNAAELRRRRRLGWIATSRQKSRLTELASFGHPLSRNWQENPSSTTDNPKWSTICGSFVRYMYFGCTFARLAIN